MKRIKYVLTLALLLTTVIGARADELTVFDGTIENPRVPVFGLYTDAYLKCEMVYPAVDLTTMAGKSISSMKFYIKSASGGTWTGSNFKVFLQEIEGTTLSSYVGLDEATVVYEGSLEVVDDIMTVNFSTAYNYNGGNLLVGFYNTKTGAYSGCSWYGTNVTGASICDYSYSSLDAIVATQRNFLPKVTFGYEGSTNSCGDGLIWTLDGTDLTISYTGEGTGVMSDYEWKCGPWGASITSVSFSDGVATIGNSAFQSCNGLSSIDIHDNVTSIGWYAFADCLALTTVTIPASVTSIGADAFHNCRNVTDVYCYADPNNLTWHDVSCNDFKEGKATLCHVPGKYLSTYQAKWSTGNTKTDVNVTFVSDDKTVLSTTQVAEGSFAGYWTTYYSSVSNMQAPEGVKVYKGSLKDNRLILKEISDRIINASEAVILKNSTEGSIELTTPVSASADSYDDNMLEGVDMATSTSIYADKTIYTLAKPNEKLGLYSFTGTTLAANKAFLTLDTSAGAPSITFCFDTEETTGIEKVERGETRDGIFYDLQGRRMTQPTKGLYIKDGKKIMVK